MSCSVIWIFEGTGCLTLISTSWLCVWAVQWSVQDCGVILFWQIVYSPPSNYQQLHTSRILNINIWTRTKTQTHVCPSVSVQMQFCFRSNPIANSTCDLGSCIMLSLAYYHFWSDIHKGTNHMRTCTNVHAVMQSSCRFVKCPVSSVRCGCEASSLISLSSLLARS